MRAGRDGYAQLQKRVHGFVCYDVSVYILIIVDIRDTKYDLYLYPVSDHGDEHIDNKLCSTISCRNDQFSHTNYFCEDLFRVFIFLYTHILFAQP